MKDPEMPEQTEERRDQTVHRQRRAPFDISDLNNIPGTTNDDPPYQSWWVVTEPDNR